MGIKEKQVRAEGKAVAQAYGLRKLQQALGVSWRHILSLSVGKTW